ncbi:MAG: IS4 family transposase [Candidatus Kapabacteria bacterium]|nr:IS4 family transposase [Candidatus Kapabacteria bacterium]
MSKNTKFSGKPIISQIISFLKNIDINRTAAKHKSDRYYKRFKTKDHLISMLYVVLSGCNSLREIESIILACEGRINHLGLNSLPKRSTLSDANRKRSSDVFCSIYFALFDQYRQLLSDSRSKTQIPKHLKIVDSTTISLFSEILRGVGRKPMIGKKKGGIKMHTMINAAEDVPSLVKFTSANVSDHSFLKDLQLKPDSIVVFDRGYNDYTQFRIWTNDKIHFVTRLKKNAVYKTVEEYDINPDVDTGVLKDEKIELQDKNGIIELRLISYWDDKNKKSFQFLTNNFDYPPDKIAEIYKRRWQIELLFKRLKQNFPLKYFLGDTQNAIEIQIWTCLIAQLILLIIQKSAIRKWSFSNLMSVIRFHLMTYIDLIKFLNNPTAGWQELKTKDEFQEQLFGFT